MRVLCIPRVILKSILQSYGDLKQVSRPRLRHEDWWHVVDGLLQAKDTDKIHGQTAYYSVSVRICLWRGKEATCQLALICQPL